MERGRSDVGVSRWRHLGKAWPSQEQEICFQKSHFKHLWWISMLRQREGNNTERNPIGIFEKSTCLGI